MGQKRIYVRSRRAAVALVLIGVVFGGMRLGTSWASSQPRGLWTAMISRRQGFRHIQLFPKPAKPLVYKLCNPEGRYPKGLAKFVLLKPWNGKNTAYLLVSWCLSSLPTLWV
jgi:hypothetical protein